MKPKPNTGGQALCTPDTPTTGSAEETSIRQLIVHGKSKPALDRAKDLHKASGSAASEALLIDAYAARIQALLDQNLMLEAKSLLELVRDRYPSAKARLEALNATSAARAGALDELLGPLADPALAADRRAAIEQAVQNTVTDLAAIAACPVLPENHDLRVAAAALDRAFGAAVSRPVTDEETALPEISRRSPLASWKLLVRAIAHFYRGEDDSCRESLAAIKPESVPARLIPAMHSMLGLKTANPLAAGEIALISRIIGNTSALRHELEKLDGAFADEADQSQILKLVRLAMQECRRSAPDQVETLKRLIWVRGAGNDMDGERMTSALQGAPRQDATFLRALAHVMETNGDPEAAALACILWEDFRQCAVREGWFDAEGVEVAALYIHMAGLLRELPDGLLKELQRGSRSNRKLALEQSYFYFPDNLYERACALDPYPENFLQWLKWADEESPRQGEDVAKAWHKVRPMDIDPLLYLLQAAEKRNAYPTALTYLDKAERIDAVHSVVRAARLRLLAGSALRHLEQKKPHLAEEKLNAMAALPQARQGDRPAFLAVLAYLIGVERGDAGAMAEARAESGRLLGSDIAAGMLALGVAAAAKCQQIGLPPLKALTEAQQLALPACIARIVTIAKDFGVVKFKLTANYLEEAVRRFPLVRVSLDIGQLRTLAESAMAGGNLQFAYAVSAEGLRRGGPTEARFLLLRARSLPGGQSGTHHLICATAAAELARQHQDSETLGEAVDRLRHVVGSEPFSLTRDQSAEVVRKEIAAAAYPIGFKGPDYSALMPGTGCDCPQCRQARGEMPGFFGDDEALDEVQMERDFNERVPPDMPPDMARLLFDTLKESFLSGMPPDKILEQFDFLGDEADGFRKRKKGKRK